jgi:single-stranded-DNA-specific exonuclease
VEAFADAFAEHALAVLGEDDLRPVAEADAVVWGDELTLDLCDELERLAPFGLGNPGPILLAPACELAELGVVGEGRHLKLAVIANRVRSGAIAFGQGAQLDRLRAGDRWDVAFRLQANRWNGTVSPQLVVRRIFETSESYLELRDRLAEEWRAGESSWSEEARAVFAELELTGEAPRRRHLVESEAFRELLTREPAALREAA